MQDLKPRNVLASLSLFIFNHYTDEPNPYVLQPLSPLPRIKQLDLRTVPKDEAFYFPLLNCLFSICCPETISLFLRRQFCTKPFAEFLYETLMGRKQGECHCSSVNECWWHGVKNVKVTCELNLDENADFKTMLDALPAAGENLFFSLEL
ncbi:hypothetical protein PIB30_056953 [Stylosanthes scabra]|uniref:Uncharacterized protein n=1 Tax=Stylosanthes scabra TaxID=79078 RepID=A0ABU6WHR9_9FABA|nr:hypothetical protein [Stylosanthes scabra]